MNTPWTQVAEIEAPIVLAIGTFDGVHKGHQELVHDARKEADRCDGQVWVLTFDPHPVSVLRPEATPALLTPLPQKLTILRHLGADGVIVIPFTEARSEQSPEAFVEELRSAVPTLREIVVGENWRFGRGASGDVALLRDLGSEHGFSVNVVSPVMQGGRPISSTRLRDIIGSGDVGHAIDLLGRCYSVTGIVAQGRKIGRELGYPTANINPGPVLRPSSGVYAVIVAVDGDRHKGATYIGTRPSYHEDGPDRDIFEIHLMDVDLALYDKEIEVFFVAHIRGDMRFDSDGALKQQIALDVDQTRGALERAEGKIPIFAD